MRISNVSQGRSNASLGVHCERMNLKATSRDEATFLAALLRAMVSGGTAIVHPSWGGSVTIDFPPMVETTEGITA